MIFRNEKGAYLKLLFLMKEIGDKKLVRPYTIRNFRKKKLEIDIDFVIHQSSNGIATEWALKASPGDEIMVSGPGAKPDLKDDVDWIFFIGDMSSLPAISSNLEEIDTNTTGIIVIEIMSNEDKLKIRKPRNFQLHWVIKKKSSNHNELYDKVLSLKWLSGNPFVWVACEFDKMKKFRYYFHKRKKKLKRIYIYIKLLERRKQPRTAQKNQENR